MRKFAYETFLFLTWLLPMLFFSYLAFVFIFFTLFPDFPLILNQKNILALSNSQFAFGLILLFVLSFIGLYLKVKEKSLNFSLPKLGSTSEWLVLLTTSYFFSYFIIRTFFELRRFNSLLILSLTLFFIFFLYNLSTFLTSPNLEYFKLLIFSSQKKSYSLFSNKYHRQIVLNFGRNGFILFLSTLFCLVLVYLTLWTLENVYAFGSQKVALILLLSSVWFLFGYLIKVQLQRRLNYLIYIFRKIAANKKVLHEFKEMTLNILKSFLIGLGIISLFAVIVGFFAWRLNRQAQIQKKLRESLVITDIVPHKSALAELVKVRGYNFGWRLNPNDKLLSDYGPVIVEEWTEQQISFRVPLNWQVGELNLWVEKYETDNDNYTRKLQSNNLQIEIASRWTYYPSQEELDRKDIGSYISRGLKKIRRF